MVLRVLSEAYADGRLDRSEYDDRSGAATSARTLGDLPPLVSDLVPVPSTRPGDDLALATPEELQTKAVARYRSRRRQAFSAMVVPSVVTFVIWFASGWGDGTWSPGIPWPLFVMLGTGVNLLRILLSRQDMIEDERTRLETKQREALEGPREETALEEAARDESTGEGSAGKEEPNLQRDKEQQPGES